MKIHTLLLALGLAAAPTLAAPPPTHGVYGQPQESAGGTTARVYVARVGRPVADPATTPVFMDVEEAVIRIDLVGAPGADSPEALTVVFGEGDGVVRLAAPGRRTPSRDFDAYPAPHGAVYQVQLPVAQVYTAPAETRNTTYAIYRTTENDDTLTFQKGLKEQAGPPYRLPRDELAFIDNSGTVSLELDANGYPVCSGLQGAGACETFEAGAVAAVPFSVLGAGGAPLATSKLLVERVPDWIYFSGHYPRGSGGHLVDASIYPEAVSGISWKGALEVLLFASCYAVEINTPRASGFYSGAGIDGARWWQKFEGTLLGYRHLAPSSAASAVTRKFLGRVGRSPVSAAEDPAGWSRMVAEAWMNGNTMDGVSATNAAAVDSEGRYYFVDDAKVSLDGVQYRTGVVWETVERSAWEPQFRQVVGEYARDKVISSSYELTNPPGAAPPTYQEVLASPRYLELMGRYGVPADDPAMLAHLKEECRQTRKDFYEGGDPWRWSNMIYERIAARGTGAPPTAEEITAIFRTDDPEIVPVLLPPEQVEELIFDEYASAVFGQALSWDSPTGFSVPVEDLWSALRKHYAITPEREQRVRARWFPEVTD